MTFNRVLKFTLLNQHKQEPVEEAKVPFEELTLSEQRSYLMEERQKIEDPSAKMPRKVIIEFMKNLAYYYDTKYNNKFGLIL